MNSILSLLSFTDEQHLAVTTRDADIVVTAGAGSGKTRALVGRYLRLLEDGLPPRSIVAITFTEKAAREMRTRIRQLIQRWLSEGLNTASPIRPEGPEGVVRSRWEVIYAELDAAPIGTIHSLCATVLRGHPAEARVDPAFEVLDEGRAAVLRAQAVESALVWAANDPKAATLFPLLTENGLRQAVSTLLGNRLNAWAAFDAVGADPLARWRARLRAETAAFLDDPTVRSAVVDLENLRADGTLARLAGDTLAAVIADFLDTWDVIVAAWEAGDLVMVLERLPQARQAMLPHKGRKNNWPDIEVPRQALTVLRSHYEATLARLLKGSVDWSLDRRAAAALPHLRAVFERAHSTYTQAKEQRRALDFDDLEAGALALLENHPEIRAYWQAETRAVLVDEFQDTNDRQRRIVYALTGFRTRPPTTDGRPLTGSPHSLTNDERPTTNHQREERSSFVPSAGSGHHVGRSSGRLFVVGDGKQSIYRFRGADVAVFREVQRGVEEAGGQTINLDLTFRAHEPLVRQLNALLEPVMGSEEDADRPYVVPFAPLRAHRTTPRDRLREPFVEFCLGLGEMAAQGREAAAGALARRLWKLHDEEGIGWGEIGLLFRASTGFPEYEDALERAGIPFVTVAGRGFYDRPEVRDLLNALRAIADPADDRALAGLLRSPAFALTDGALYLLRRGEDGTKRSLWAALHGDLSLLDDEDASRAERAREILAKLNDLVGRITVAQVLKRFLDLTHYQAILRSFTHDRSSAVGGPFGCAQDRQRSAVVGERARRNVDKLLADAHASRLVSVGEFLEYLQTLRDVAAREGEAPVEAGDAVQIMTVHKAKGLEFPVVVIADAARQPRGTVPRLLLDEELGPVVSLEEGDRRSVVHRLVTLRDQDKDDAEKHRLLYVAATRAREKLLICGHVNTSTAKKHPGKLLLSGWLKQLGQVVGLDQVRVEGMPEETVSVELSELGGGPVGCSISPTTADSLLRRDMRRSPTALGQTLTAVEQSTRESLAVDVGDVLFPPPLLEPVVAPPVEQTDETLRAREADPPPRVWRVVPTAQRPRGPAWVVGTLVHEALRRWHFPDREGFDDFLRLHALEAGLTDEAELRATLREVRRLLNRFQAYPLYAEMEGAQRYHEVPFAVEREGRVEAGQIDVLYRHAGRWRIVDFKTDEIRDEDEFREKAAKHAQQVRAYMEAVGQLLKTEPEGLLCYLNVAGEVRVEPVVGSSATSRR